MKSIDVPVLREAPGPQFPVSRGNFRRACARFWLNFLFFHAEHAPWVVRATKGFFLWFAQRFSKQIQSATGNNARRILGDGSTPRQRWAFGRAVIGSFYDFVYDVGRCRSMSREQLLGQIESVEGDDHYRAARAGKRGAIIVTAHMGSFEVGMAALCELEKKVHVVFKRDAEDRFEQIRMDLRRRLGVSEAPVDEGWTVWMRLRDALMNDEVVLIQGDRVMPGQKGQRTPFLGGKILLPTGPVKLAIASGAPIVPVFAIRTPSGKIRLMIEAAIDVAGDEQPVGGLYPSLRKVAQAIEKHVKRWPEQWLVLHDAFCADEGLAGDARV